LRNSTQAAEPARSPRQAAALGKAWPSNRARDPAEDLLRHRRLHPIRPRRWPHPRRPRFQCRPCYRSENRWHRHKRRPSRMPRPVRVTRSLAPQVQQSCRSCRPLHTEDLASTEPSRGHRMAQHPRVSRQSCRSRRRSAALESTLEECGLNRSAGLPRLRAARAGASSPSAQPFTPREHGLGEDRRRAGEAEHLRGNRTEGSNLPPSPQKI
jgi:hypothetical protein